MRVTASPAGGSVAVGTLRNVQALRAIAALLVVLVHATLPHVGVEDVLGAAERPWLTPLRYIGLFGVDLFFAISGFIMLATNWQSFGRPLAGVRFFARRAIRIYPPYWLALLPVVAALTFAKDRFMPSHVGVRTGVIESILLLPQPHHFILTVAWTLVWELIFYVVFAALLVLDRRYVPAALGIWLVGELVLYGTLSGAQNFYAHFASAPLPIEFICGALVGVLYVKRKLRAPWAFMGLAFVATALSWSVVAITRVELDPSTIARVLMFGLPAALIVYGAVALEAHSLLIAPPWVAAVGDASYAIYLWHLSILVVLRQVIERLHPAGALAHGAIIATTVAIIVLLGMSVYRFFEKPMTKHLNGLLARGLQSRQVSAAAPALGRVAREAAVDGDLAVLGVALVRETERRP